MYTSVIHVKAPHELHIAVKVAALKSGKSMNQFAVDCLTEAVGEEQVAFTKQVLSPKPITIPQGGMLNPVIKTPKDALKILGKSESEFPGFIPKSFSARRSHVQSTRKKK